MENFYCQIDQNTMKSVPVYADGDVFYRGEEETFYHGPTMISRIAKMTAISKDDVICLLKEEISKNHIWLNDSIQSSESFRASLVLDGIEELSGILIKFTNDEKIAEEINSMKFLFELRNDWTSSKFYYFETSDSFFEKKYHEEYLDTGTVCEGLFPISDDALWKQIDESNSEIGKEEFRKIRSNK